MLSWFSSTWLGRLDTPYLWRGFQFGRLVAMALLANEEDKDAIELDGSIGGALTDAPLLQSVVRLPACEEQSLGENGLLEGP